MRLLLLLAGLGITISVSAQEINIIPKPKFIELKKGSFVITPATVIVSNDINLQSTINFFNRHLKTYYGFELKIVKKAVKNYIQFEKNQPNGQPLTGSTF